MTNDWSQLVSGDLQLVNLNITDDQIRQMNQTPYKTKIKQKVCDADLLSNLLTNKQSSLLYNLRCETVSGIRDNFHRQYPDIKCQLCLQEVDTQSHVLCCPFIKNQFKEY